MPKEINISRLLDQAKQNLQQKPKDPNVNGNITAVAINNGVIDPRKKSNL